MIYKWNNAVVLLTIALDAIMYKPGIFCIQRFLVFCIYCNTCTQIFEVILKELSSIRRILDLHGILHFKWARGVVVSNPALQAVGLSGVQFPYPQILEKSATLRAFACATFSGTFSGLLCQGNSGNRETVIEV